MREAFDRRVVPEDALALVRACQRRVPAHLAGGAALSGAYLAHRLSGDLDLFCHRAEDVRVLVRELPDIANESKRFRPGRRHLNGRRGGGLCRRRGGPSHRRGGGKTVRLEGEAAAEWPRGSCETCKVRTTTPETARLRPLVASGCSSGRPA